MLWGFKVCRVLVRKQFQWLCLFLVSGLVSTAVVADFDKIIIAYENKTQFPYYLGNTNNVLPQPGAAVELVRRVGEVLGIEIEFRRYPWSRCLAMLENGDVDAIFNASYSSERAEYAAYPLTDTGVLDASKRLTAISYSWYSFVPEAPLASAMVAAPQGYSIVKPLREMDYRVYEAAQSSSALKMVLAGYVTHAALQTVTGDHLLATNDDFAQLVRVDPPLVIKPYFLLLSKKFQQENPALTQSIWQALAQLREQELEQIVIRYLLEAKQ